MKDFFKTFSKGIVFGLGIIFVLGISYIFIKARQSSSTGLPTDSNPSALYVGEGETLTAAKWNSLVAKSGGLNMKKYTGTTSTSSPTSFAHGLDLSKIMGVDCMIKRLGTNFLTMGYLFRYNNIDNNRLIEITSSNINIYYKNDTTAYGGKEYRCIVFYTD